MTTNPARAALSRAVNRAIAEGAPVYVEQPAHATTPNPETLSAETIRTALCVWEAMLEANNLDSHGRMARRWAAIGTVAMRDDAIALAPYCESVYAAMAEDVRDVWAFDWEIVPAILRTLEWSDSGAVLVPADDMAARVAAGLA